MDSKSQRLLAIKKLIQTQKISSQDELLRKLRKEGFDPTQATISRDLKALQVGRKADPEKGSIFSLPDQHQSLQEASGPDLSFLTSAIQAIHFAHQFAIIKTLPGYANSVAIAIDKAGRYEITGTIAGDDTILLIPSEGVERKEVRRALITIFPALKDTIFFPSH